MKVDYLKVVSNFSQKQMGKNSLADYVAPRLTRKIPVPCHGGGTYEDAPWGQASFAAAVKDIFCKTFNKNLAFIEEWKTKDECPPGMMMPVRKALVFIGDGFRKIDPDIWVNIAFRAENDPYGKIFTDGRFINEARKSKQENGVNILIYRENGENWDNCQSEREILPYILWCKGVKKEGKISEWDEFKEKRFDFLKEKSEYNFWVSAEYLIEECCVGDHSKLVKYLSQGCGSDFTKKFFDNLALLDLFIRSEDGLEHLHAKAESIVLPYLRDNFSFDWV